MNVLTCPEVLERLEAFHDQELPLSDQIAVGSHLGWCVECGAAFTELQLVSTSLRAAAPGRIALVCRDDDRLQTSVLGRVQAEQAVSFDAEVRRMFEDTHAVLAALSSAAAAVVCAFAMLGMMQWAVYERPDSLAAMLKTLASPGSNGNPVSAGSRVQMPRPLEEGFHAGADLAGEDAVFALAAVVTREGRVASLELIRGSATVPGSDSANVVQELLDTASRARFAPASVEGLPVAVNMVWIVAQTTVKGTKSAADLLPSRARAKKQIASLPPTPPVPSVALLAPPATTFAGNV